jgi:5-methylcytosine-specific restriction endonuclease McrA
MAISNRTRICNSCGSEFVRTAVLQPTKTCLSCIANHACKWCGKSISHKNIRQETCDLSCANFLMAQRQGLRCTITTFACLGCQKEVTRSVRKSRDSGKYCSRDCSFQHQTIIRAKTKADRLTALQPLRDAARIEAARLKLIKTETSALKRIGRAQRKRLIDLGKKSVSCLTCDTLIDASGCKPKRCSSCLEATAREARRAWRKKKRSLGFDLRKHKERAAKYGCEYDRTLSAIAIFDRDGWMCQACGVATPKHLKGSYDPCAPELDHIIPMSKQGPHIASNVQCLCRQCNSDKGAQIVLPAPRGDIPRVELFNT